MVVVVEGTAESFGQRSSRNRWSSPLPVSMVGVQVRCRLGGGGGVGGSGGGGGDGGVSGGEVWVVSRGCGGGLFKVNEISAAASKTMDEMWEKLRVYVAAIPLKVAAAVPVPAPAPVFASLARKVCEARAVTEGSSAKRPL